MIYPLSILVVRHVAHGGYPDLVGVIQLVPPVGIEPTCALTHLFYRQASLPAGARRPLCPAIADLGVGITHCVYLCRFVGSVTRSVEHRL